MPITSGCSGIPTSDVAFRRISTVGREGFEPSKAEPADLQSAPFGHLGTDPSADTTVGQSEPLRQSSDRGGAGSVGSCMPSFDVTSEVDLQEVRNAVDQASREVATRFDFKDTGASVELKGHEIHLNAPTEDRLRALVQVLEEKLVRRQVSLKALSYGKIEEAARGALSARRSTLNAGISPTTPGRSTRPCKDLEPQGRQLADPGRPGPCDRQEAGRPAGGDPALKEEDFGIPLQFGNFRD